MTMTDADWERTFQRFYGEFSPLSAGYFASSKALALGYTSNFLEEGLARGEFTRVDDVVLRFTVSPPLAHEREVAAWLRFPARAEAVVSHQTALALHGIAPGDPAVHVTLPLGRTPPDGLPPHVIVHLGSVSDRVGFGGLVTTTVQRAFEDCAAAGADPAYLEAARALASNKGLLKLTGKKRPKRGPAPDDNLRLALAGELMPLAAIDEARASGPEALRRWALRQSLSDDPDEPLERLVWNERSLLRLAAGDLAVKGVHGLEAFAQLRVLVLRPSRLVALAPLGELPALEALEIGVTAKTSLEPLRSCAALRRARIDGLQSAAQRRVRRELEAAGVVVDVVGERGAPDATPFVDPMLKLAVLEALGEHGPALPELIPIDAFELDRENLARLVALPLAEGALARVEQLVWLDGGMRMQQLVWPQFDGESREFALRSIAGIDALPNLRSVRVSDGAIDDTQLAALRARGVQIVLEQ